MTSLPDTGSTADNPGAIIPPSFGKEPKEDHAQAQKLSKQKKWEKRQKEKEEKARLEDMRRREDARRQQAADEHYMRAALRQARKAEALNEVPIGCVIVRDGQIIARGYNRRNADLSTLSHAELNAIRKASKKLGDWRLEGCTIYVTLEPCQMCSGAIVQSRIDRCVIGAMNPKAGCAGSVLNLLQIPRFNHQVSITTGVLGVECSRILSDFFSRLREEKDGK